MFKSKLERFVAKRVLILFVLLTILDVVLINDRWFVFWGLLLGGIINIIKFSSTVSFFSKLFSPENESGSIRRGTFRYIINQVVTIVLFVAALKFSLWLFLGAVAGILLVPAVIMINGFTEALGITHNSFE